MDFLNSVSGPGSLTNSANKVSKKHAFTQLVQLNCHTAAEPHVTIYTYLPIEGNSCQWVLSPSVSDSTPDLLVLISTGFLQN